MDYVTLGKTGLSVSAYCFGTMSFGGDADEETSATLYARCREVGINFFDCANVYQGGRSEQILGELIKHERENVIITSKVYFPMGDDVNARGASRHHIMLSVEKSLKRLQTDYIDVYLIHRFDDHTALEETIRTLDDLVRQGKIHYIGASNFAAWQVAKALGISSSRGWARFECIQPMYNLVKRQAEVELMPMAISEKVGVIPYSPLGGGLLTGKYGSTKRPESGRIVDMKTYQARYSAQWNFDAASSFAEFAQEHGYEPAGLAVAWVASHPAVTAPLLGARNVKQLEGSLTAIEINMTPELRAEISMLTPEPPPATDRIEERTNRTFDSR